MTALALENREDVIFSATAATTGGHGTLTHLPGGALWGRTAAAFYQGHPDLASRAVHGAALRLSNGYPLTHTGRPAFPMPQSLREPKPAKGGVAGGVLTDAVWNLADDAGARTEGAGDALKRLYLAADGSVVRPMIEERGKTAVEQGGRRAATSQYFQYEHLCAGQRWVCWIEGDRPLVEIAVKALADQGRTLRLGRSSLKEFGGQFTAKVKALDDPREGQLTAAGVTGRLVLWCLSDLACIDAGGLPDLAPSLSALVAGAPDTPLSAAYSSIGTRRYSPWNTHLDRPDREHAVIEAGSVLVYDLTAPLDLAAFRDGVGLWRERGLGRLWPNPPLLMAAQPIGAVTAKSAESGAPAAMATERPSEPSDPDDLAVLKRARGLKAKREEAVGLESAFGALLAAFEARLVIARKQKEPVPTATQWSGLASRADQATDLAALQSELFRTDRKGWCDGPEWTALAPFLKQQFEAAPAPKALARVAWRLRQTQGDGQ